jgi:WD40 repeat protein
MHLKDYNFEGCDLSNLYLPHAKLRYINFFKANLENTNFRNSDLRGANFTDANLRNADIRSCKLSGISFLRSSIRSITILDDYENIAYVGDSYVAKIWNWKTDKTIVLEGEHERRLRKIVYDKVNKIIAAGGYDNNISLWDSNGKLKKKFMYHSEPVLGLGFSPDGKYLVSGDNTGKIVVNELAINKTKTIESQKDSIREILFIDDERFISASCDNTVVMYNVKTFCLEKIIGLHKDYAFSVAYNPIKNIIASVGADRAIKVVKIDENRELTLDAKKSLRDVEISTNGQYIAVGGKSGKVQIWKDYLLFMTWEAHNICVRDSIFIDNDILITSGDDSSIKIWKIDYEKATAYCLGYKVDMDVNSSNGKDILCDGLKIRGAHGLPSDRRGWLYRHGAIREKKKT